MKLPLPLVDAIHSVLVTEQNRNALPPVVVTALDEIRSALNSADKDASFCEVDQHLISGIVSLPGIQKLLASAESPVQKAMLSGGQQTQQAKREGMLALAQRQSKNDLFGIG